MSRKEQVKRVIHTRGNAAETPNWRFGLTTCVPRKEVPELCEGLAYIAQERNGGSYYYPDYRNGKMAAAFEWYLSYRGWKFGYKVGVEFWIEEGNLERLGAYVLYGEDHPRRGSSPEFTESEKREFQCKVIKTISLAENWRTRLPLQQFYTVHYLQLPAQGAVKTSVEIPSLNAYILPTVLMGKENARVSAVIQAVPARFREEAKHIGSRDFLRLCALLTLATGGHHEPYKSTLGRTPLKQFVDSISPIPTLQSVYPKDKCKTPAATEYELSLGCLKLASDQYCCLDLDARSKFDDCLFAYYTAKDLLGKRFQTVGVVALIAALKPFRRTTKCNGSITCSQCGVLNYRHNTSGEAASIANELCDDFGFDAEDKRRADLQQLIRCVYRTQRSAYVHDAVLRHGEFGRDGPRYVPTEKSVISEQLTAHNQLLTLEFLTRRALLQHLAKLASQRFDPIAYGIEPDKFKVTLGSMGQFVVGSKVLVGIRAMGRF